MLVRMNSLIRSVHCRSVFRVSSSPRYQRTQRCQVRSWPHYNEAPRSHRLRYELIERLGDLLRENITPFVPLRGSISASGDLSPLSYVAGTIVGNPSIRVFDGPAVFGARKIVSSRDALKAHGLEPLPLVSKEHLGILNGTAFSASVGSLAVHEATHLALLAQVCTAMGVEALSGTQGSFDRFIHDVARPHPGQIESAQIIWNLLDGSKLAHRHTKQDDEVELHSDKYSLRQDRYPLRTAPQFLGPQIEDILAAAASLKQEINSSKLVHLGKDLITDIPHQRLITPSSTGRRVRSITEATSKRWP